MHRFRLAKLSSRMRDDFRLQPRLSFSNFMEQALRLTTYSKCLGQVRFISSCHGPAWDISKTLNFYELRSPTEFQSNRKGP